MKKIGTALAVAMLMAGPALAADQEHHDHPVPEKLGMVTFETSCDPAVKAGFERAVALLHSFAYAASRTAFRTVADKDPRCAMAYWGMAMSHYHALWEPQVDSQEELREGAAEIARAGTIAGISPREHQFIQALQQYYAGWESTAPGVRAASYSQAMADVAKANAGDDEAQIFYALSLLATASRADRRHANQKRAIAILGPIWQRQPQHPGATHYLIHATDSAELAPRGLAAARAYSRIAPSAPHALHMPSHIFTRLGLWQDSIASNEKARAAAHAEGDIGEELHAMDYLTYAYLQLGQRDEAAKVVAAARAMAAQPAAPFKISYAANVMPVRLAVESGDWKAAAVLQPLPGTPPKVAASVHWARALGHSRARVARSADEDIAALQACVDTLRAAGDAYWASQAEVMLKAARAWAMAARGDGDGAVALLRSAADQEDALEKLPITPGPIVPAREQLGELLLSLNRPQEAQEAFNAVLALAPGRRGARLGASAAGERVHSVVATR